MKRYFLLALLIVACDRDIPPTPPEIVESDSADQILEGFMTTTRRGNGAVVSMVEADSAWYYINTRSWVLKRLKVTFPDSMGRTISTITARNGTFNGYDESLDARDSVVGTTPDGKLLRTQHLLWDKLSNLVLSDSAFTMREVNGSVTRGSSFTATPDFKRLDILKGSIIQAREKATAKKKAPAKPPATRAPADSVKKP